MPPGLWWLEGAAKFPLALLLHGITPQAVPGVEGRTDSLAVGLILGCRQAGGKAGDGCIDVFELGHRFVSG